MLYRISVAERGLTGIANIFRSRLSGLDDLLRAGTVPLTITVGLVTSRGLCGAFFLGTSLFLRIECLCGPLHTYWHWVSMLMLMVLERNFYFVFVHRMFLPF